MVKEKLFKLLFPDYYKAYQYFKKHLKELRFEKKIVNKYADLPDAINHDGEIWEVLFETADIGKDFGKYVSLNERWYELYDSEKPLFNHADIECFAKINL